MKFKDLNINDTFKYQNVTYVKTVQEEIRSCCSTHIYNARTANNRRRRILVDDETDIEKI